MNATDLAVLLYAAGNSNGCPDATGIQQFADDNEQVSIYPNPASQLVNLTISRAPSGPFDNSNTNNIEIINVMGGSVHHQIIKSSNSQIGVSELADGVYTISIRSTVGFVNKT
ncbi:MAG: T9SS type A sorting domain-containing protein [Bacteroidia bacterium]